LDWKLIPVQFNGSAALTLYLIVEKGTGEGVHD